LYQKINKSKNPWVPMNTHGYLNIRGYLYSGYAQGYEADTSIIFIQRSGNEYHTICIYRYPWYSNIF